MRVANLLQAPTTTAARQCIKTSQYMGRGSFDDKRFGPENVNISLVEHGPTSKRLASTETTSAFGKYAVWASQTYHLTRHHQVVLLVVSCWCGTYGK